MKRIKLTRGKYAIVDDEDYERINAFKWRVIIAKYTCYAERSVPIPGSKKYRSERMHHAIIGFPKKDLVSDHINGNGIDNRKENLRNVSVRMNALNRAYHRKKQMIGSHYCKRWDIWKSCIVFKDKVINLGGYKTKEEANEVYMLFLKAIDPASHNLLSRMKEGA